MGVGSKPTTIRSLPTDSAALEEVVLGLSIMHVGTNVGTNVPDERNNH
jgi:hypothetical protein